MSRKDIARRLVALKAVKDLLEDASADTRDQAREEYESGDADSVTINGVVYGRVRRDKPTQTWQVINWSEFNQWVQEHVPHAWIAIPQVDPTFRAAVLKSGTYIDRETGEVLQVGGVGLKETPGNVVVTVTDEAREQARQILGKTLPELES